MIVQHNLTAMNSNRMLNLTVKSQAKSTERLSSGYRINRAADDAAGLSISEKMRKQIRGLTQASANAQDGISMVQTADGAMAEVSDMLQRGNELAVKAANGTLSADDRSYIHAEIKQLEEEIERVRATTKFNEIYVLQGDVEEEPHVGFSGLMPEELVTSKSLEKGGYQDKIDASENVYKPDGTAYNSYGIKLDFSEINATNISRLYNTGYCATCNSCSAFTNIIFTDDPVGTNSFSGIESIPESDIEETDPGFNYTSFKDSTVIKVGIKGLTSGQQVVDAVMAAASANAGTTWDGTKAIQTKRAGVGLHNVSLFAKGAVLYTIDHSNNPSSPTTSTTGLSQSAVANGIFGNFKTYAPKYEDCDLQIGADATANNRLTVKLANISVKSMGLVTWDALGRKWKDVSVETQSEALEAIDKFKNAIQYVSSERSRMGAYQNRLEHTINNLDNVVENTTAAESAIRDTDMATEMVRYSNNNILAQAGQAMLAQANQSNQGVLSLLQ